MRFTHKQIWVITFPILVSLLMEHLINMTDTAFLGRVGEVELGASALAGVYYMAIYMLAFGFSIGAQILIGRRNGEGNYKDIGPIFIQGVLFLVGLATLMFTVSRIYTPSVLRSVIDSEQVYVGHERLHEMANIRFLLLVCRRHVPGLLRGNHHDTHTHDQFACHGRHQCRAELPVNFR